MLGASYSLELSARVLTEQKNPEETEDIMANRLIQGSIHFWCLKGISEDGIQALFKVSHGMVQKRIVLTTLFQGKEG